MARAYRPPSWIATFELSAAHGLLFGGLTVGITDLSSWMGWYGVLPIVASVLAVITYAALIAWRPYVRVLAISCWLSPMVAVAGPYSILYSLDARGALSPIELLVLCTPVLGVVNAFTYLFVTAYLKASGRMPIRPRADCPTCRQIVADRLVCNCPTCGRGHHGVCANCGYFLADLADPRCPECGTPIPPTPRA